MSKPTYRIPSGMGGIFIVKIQHDAGNGMVRVRIYMPGNPDFHGHVLTVNRDKLELEQ
jgi:hypothetical protein